MAQDEYSQDGGSSASSSFSSSSSSSDDTAGPTVYRDVSLCLSKREIFEAASVAAFGATGRKNSLGNTATCKPAVNTKTSPRLKPKPKLKATPSPRAKPPAKSSKPPNLEQRQPSPKPPAKAEPQPGTSSAKSAKSSAKPEPKANAGPRRLPPAATQPPLAPGSAALEPARQPPVESLAVATQPPLPPLKPRPVSPPAEPRSQPPALDVMVVQPPPSPAMGSPRDVPPPSPSRAGGTGAGKRRLSLGQAMMKAVRGDNESEQQDDVSQDQGPGGLFMDADALKLQIRKNLMKPAYDVSMYYKKTGVWQAIATSPLFDKITLSVIALNAVWIGVDTDHNTAEVLLTAAPTFQIAEHCFCLFFAFEWWCRFQSFKHKRSGLRDAWFMFDTCLVFTMVMETWLLTIIMFIIGGASGGSLGNASILRMARLARLSRMARMARLLRAMPELMILLKGIAAATRSVFFTLILLCLLLYVFAIAFTQLTVDTEVGDLYFPDIGASMYTLLVCGTLMDNIGGPLSKLGQLGLFYAAIYLLFVLLATVTVMNMLIGVLCEVVSTVATVEKETLAVTYVKDRLQTVLEDMDEDGNGTISKDEFVNVLENREAVETLNDVGVDVVGLTGFADVIFQDENDSTKDRELTFGAFMENILQFRGTNLATVKDVMDFHKFVKQKLNQATDELRALTDDLRAMQAGEAPCTAPTPPGSGEAPVPPLHGTAGDTIAPLSVGGTQDPREGLPLLEPPSPEDLPRPLFSKAFAASPPHFAKRSDGTEAAGRRRPQGGEAEALAPPGTLPSAPVAGAAPSLPPRFVTPWPPAAGAALAAAQPPLPRFLQVPPAAHDDNVNGVEHKVLRHLGQESR